jgi:uncharacterized protein
MVTEDQSNVIAFLEAASTHGGAAVERIDTHTAVVFLAGPRALKLKRAVRYDYLDFSTVSQRQSMCEAEVRLNSRTAPSLYRGVVPIVRTTTGALALGGPGAVVDWVIEMKRFDQDLLLDRLADAGRLSLDGMSLLGRTIAEFHRDAPRRADHGGSRGMAWVIDGNTDDLARFGSPFLDPTLCARLAAATRAQLERQQSLLDERRTSGYVRQCHGDLHLRNLVMMDGRPTLFDAIEFNDEVACTDVLYDLGFLLMDLWHRRLPVHANRVFNAYLAEAFDPGGLPLLPLFLSCRAAIRAKTTATAASLQTGAVREESIRLAREYLALADEFLHVGPPRLLAIGGFSGSGKSTLALTLAPDVGLAPGAVVLRSDEIRKRLFGVPALQRLDPSAYTTAVSGTVYRTLAESARLLLAAGRSVIVDAVFADGDDRKDMQRVAASCGVAFTGLWLDAPESVLLARLRGRGVDVSDADEVVVRHQLADGAGTIDWHRLNAAATATSVASAALNVANTFARLAS